MVHSIELVFDRDTEAAVRRIWEELAGAGIPSQAPASRPHVTMAVADRISSEVDELLSPVAATLPLSCAIGAPVLFGRASVVFARLQCQQSSCWHCTPRYTGCVRPIWTRRRCRIACPGIGPAMSPWPGGSVGPSWGGHCGLPAAPHKSMAVSPACAAGTGTNALSNRSHDGAQHGEITAQRAVGYRVRFVQPCTATLSWQFCARQARARPQILTKTRGVLGDSGGYSTQQ